jgi:hypothetical protein
VDDFRKVRRDERDRVMENCSPIESNVIHG